MTRCEQFSSAFVVMLRGQTIEGGCLSWTVTVKLQLLVLPLESATVQFTAVIPREKTEPLAGTQKTLVTAQLSFLEMGG